MRRVTKTAFIAASSIISRALALQVTPGSACASVCLDSAQGDTQLDPSDIVCDDSDYFSSKAGVKFKKCEECLQTSKTVNGSESDSSRFLCEPSLPYRSLLMPNLTWLCIRQPTVRLGNLPLRLPEAQSQLDSVLRPGHRVQAITDCCRDKPRYTDRSGRFLLLLGRRLGIPWF